MTTYAKVKQTIASLEGVKATLQLYGETAQEESARKTFQRNAEKLDDLIRQLKKRQQKMEFEEPQYKGF